MSIKMLLTETSILAYNCQECPAVLGAHEGVEEGVTNAVDVYQEGLYGHQFAQLGIAQCDHLGSSGQGLDEPKHVHRKPADGEGHDHGEEHAHYLTPCPEGAVGVLPAVVGVEVSGGETVQNGDAEQRAHVAEHHLAHVVHAYKVVGHHHHALLIVVAQPGPRAVGGQLEQLHPLQDVCCRKPGHMEQDGLGQSEERGGEQDEEANLDGQTGGPQGPGLQRVYQREVPVYSSTQQIQDVAVCNRSWNRKFKRLKLDIRMYL